MTFINEKHYREVSLKKVYQIPDRAKTEERPCEAEARPSQLKKNCLEAASSRSRCLEDSIPANIEHKVAEIIGNEE